MELWQRRYFVVCVPVYVWYSDNGTLLHLHLLYESWHWVGIQCGRSSSSFHFFFFLFRFLPLFLLFSPLLSALCHSFGSCWRQITGTGGLYLLYWALDSQVCIQCWWMFLMSRARCECECVSVCVHVYTRVCVVMCVGCLKWSAWGVESRGWKKIKATGNMLVFAIHRQMGSHSTQICDRKLARLRGFCDMKITMTPCNRIQITLSSHFTLFTKVSPCLSFPSPISSAFWG